MSRSFSEVLTDAVAWFAERGYASEEDLKRWIDELARAARGSVPSDDEVKRMLRDAMSAVWRRLVDRGGAIKRHAGLGRFSIERVRPELRAELERRIVASANLIRLNRGEMIDRTLRRFAGWASSIPPGGASEETRRKVKEHVGKPISSMKFAERRVAIDQGHKLAGAIDDVVAKGNGALAVIWRSNWRQANYDYREEHKERDGKVYAIRPNWAIERGLMKAGPDGWYDEITSFGQEVFCRCYGTYVYAIRDLPDAMITIKGRAELEKARVA
jgi:hypothetical protein